MTSSRGRLVSTWLIIAMTAASLSAASAQDEARKILRIKSLDSRKIRTPIYRVSNAPQGRTREWLEITCEYETAPEWVDELGFRYYALFKNPEAKTGPGYILFSGDVAYVNVQRNVGMGRHKSLVYINPSTLERYGAVEGIAVEVRSAGQLQGVESSPTASKKWWEQLTPVPGYVLNRMETPFAMINFDDEEALKAGGTP